MQKNTGNNISNGQTGYTEQHIVLEIKNQTIGPTKRNKKPILVNPLAITNFILTLGQTNIYPIRKSSTGHKYIAINMAKIDLKFIKASNN